MQLQKQLLIINNIREASIQELVSYEVSQEIKPDKKECTLVILHLKFR